MTDPALLDEVPLPWQQRQWKRLCQQADSRKLAHAYLFSGAAGTGKLLFARRFADYLLCLAPVEGMPCGHCRHCQIGGRHQHPDVTIVAPLEGKRDITIDQIRELTALASTTSHAGGHKVLIIDQAHRMNHATANALLKTLEEPAGDALIVLITELPGFLPATIRSRCHRLQFPAPRLQLADSWLKKHCTADLDTMALLAVANCRPLFALDIAETDIVKERREFMEQLSQLVAGKLSPQALVGLGLTLGEKTAVDYLLISSALLIKSLLGQRDESVDCPGLTPLIELLQKHKDPVWLLRRLMQRYQEAVTARRQLLSGANPNAQLVLESLSWRWRQLLQTGARQQRQEAVG